MAAFVLEATTRSGHGKGASRRLRAEAKRTGARRDILAWLRHEIGIVQRTTGGRP
jgi:hypothetical protein